MGLTSRREPQTAAMGEALRTVAMGEALRTRQATWASVQARQALVQATRAVVLVSRLVPQRRH